MATATIQLQNRPHYRVDAFKSGFERAGYKVQLTPKRKPEPGDVLLLWNRMRGRPHTMAQEWTEAGAHVLIAENGYIGRDNDGGKLFALAFDHHLGRGRWHVGDGERWKGQNIELHSWRRVGEDIVLLPQRGIGEPGIAMPPGWDVKARARIREHTDRTVRIRKHPGAIKHEPYEDLDQAFCVGTWASGAAIKAICYGVPALYGLPGWIGAPASTPLSLLDRADSVDDIVLRDDEARVTMLERLAWAQWSVSEIESGFAIDWIMQCA